MAAGSPRIRAAGLTIPLIAFIGVTFIAPLGTLLTRSVYDAEVAEILPETLAVLADWDGSGTPSEATYATIGMELLRARDERTLGRAATRINRIQSGLRSVVVKTPRRLGRDVDTDPPSSWREALVAIDDAWAETATWRAIHEAGQPFTARHFLNAVDLETRPDGSIGAMPETRRIYVPLYLRTLWVSLGVTALCLVIGYPIAHAIAHAGSRWSTTLLVLVLVPFWTSLLVRTTAWIVLLQNQGVVNDILVVLGIVPDNATDRHDLQHDRHVRRHDPRAAAVHGAAALLGDALDSGPPHGRRGISRGNADAGLPTGSTWPQTLPGVGAGSLLVFILAIGYYITPALVGGQSGQLISNMIAYHMQTSLNWGLAAALAAILLLAVIGLYVLYDRVVGIDRMRLG